MGSAFIREVGAADLALYIPKATFTAADSLITASGASTPVELAVAASRIIGKKAAGGLAALTPAEAATVIGIHGVYSYYINSAALTNAKQWFTGSSVDATVGIRMPYACHIKFFAACNHCTALSGAATVTWTLWNANQTAGSEIITLAYGITLNHGNDSSSTTIANSGKDAIAAGGKLLVSGVLDAGTATATAINFLIGLDWD